MNTSAFHRIAIFLVLLVLISVSLCEEQQYPSDRVTYLPGLGDLTNSTSKQYAGYVTVNDKEGAGLFYWFFEREGDYDKSENTPIVLWLNGGPGCSAQIGLFVELGPYRVQPDFTLQRNPHSWTTAAHILFVDQPVGVGYSYVNDSKALTRNETLVAEHMFILFKEFFRRHPEYKNLDLYLTGESYAGKYIPSIATRIVQANEDPNEVHLNLKGIAIGDGLIDPVIQRAIKPTQAYWSGVLGHTQLEQSTNILERCIRQVQRGIYKQKDGACAEIRALLILSSGTINIYDVRKFEPSTNKTMMELYLNTPEVKKALHVDHINPTYQPCSKKQVYVSMNSDILVSVKHLIPYLAKKMRVVLYNGNFDLQDGPIGTEHALLSLGIKEFNDAPRNLWVVNERVAGYEQTAHENLTFVVVHGAGHFVPTDQPITALDLLRRVIHKKPFCTAQDVVPVRFSALTPVDVEKYLQGATEVPCRITQLICTKVFKNCFGNGDCINGKCFCKPGFTGPTCLQPYVALTPEVFNKTSKLQPQDWHIYNVTMDEPLTITIQVTNITRVHHPTLAEFGVPFEEPIIGRGLGTIAPYDRLCIYGRRDGGIPTYTHYDFIHCVTFHEVALIRLPLPKPFIGNTVTIGLFNALNGGIDLDYQITYSEYTGESQEKFSPISVAALSALLSLVLAVWFLRK